MATPGILIDFDDLASFSPACQAELRTYVLGKLGATHPAPTPPASNSRRSRLVKLDLPAAEQFLENCGSKTISVLKQIVARKGAFLLADIASALNIGQGGLGGVWGGLTKRTRTITGDNNARFVDWKWTNGKWHGRVASVTVASFAKALQHY